MLVCESSYLRRVLNWDDLCPGQSLCSSAKNGWDNIGGGNITDCSSQKKGSYLYLNAVIS